MFFLLQGIYTKKQLTHIRYPRWHKARSLKNLSPSKRAFRLKNYFKFAIARNPLERLLSAYLSKIKYEDRLYYSNVKEDIIEWSRCSNQSHTISPTPQFDEFISYYLSHHKLMGQHFQMMLDICSPCLINYDFYVDYKVLDYDMSALLHLLKIDKSYYSNDKEDRHASFPDVNEQMSAYYSKLQCHEGRRLLYMMADELKFYYSLYPEETDMHLKYLPKD